MKNSLKMLATLIILSSIAVTSCTESSNNDDSSPATLNGNEYDAIQAELSTLESLEFNSADAPAIGGPDNGRLQSEPSCYTIDFIENDDGSGALSYVFQDGCELNGVALTGSLTINFQLSEDLNYQQTTNYEDFTVNDVQVSGTQTLSSSFSSMGELGPDFQFNSEIITTSDLTIVSCDGQSYALSSSTARSSSFQGETVYQLDELITGDGVQYETTLVADLFLDFQCRDNRRPTYSRGTVRTVSQDWTRTVDYGDGTCDDRITITENGETREVSVDELEGTQEKLCDV